MEASAKILLSQKGYGQLDQAAGMPGAKPLSPMSLNRQSALSPKTAAQSYGHTHSSSLAQQFSRLKSEENLDDFKGFEGV